MDRFDDTPRNPTKRNRRWWFWLLCVLALAAALRLYDLGHWSLWKDEGTSIYVSETLGPSNLLNPVYMNDAPLLPLLVHFWYEMLKTLTSVTPGSALCDAMLRLLPAFFGVLSVALTFFVGRLMLEDDRSALLGAFLFAISPFQVFYAQELRPYTLLAALCLIALIFLWQSLYKNRWWHWIGLTLSLALAVYAQFVAVWFVTALNVYFVLKFRSHWRLLPRWIVCNLAVIVLVIPALRKGFFIRSVFERATVQWYPWPTPRIVLITFKDFFSGYSPNATAYKLLFLLCGAMALAGVYRLRKNPRALLLLVTVAVFPAVAYAWASNQSKFPYYTHRLMIASAAPVYLLVAHGLGGLRGRAVMGIAIAVIGGLTLPALDDYYHQRFHPLWDHMIGVIYKPQNREASHYICPRLREDDLVGHRNDLTWIPFQYYLREGEACPCGSPDQRLLSFSAGYRYESFKAYPHEPLYERYGLVPIGLEPAAAEAKRIWLVQSDWKPTEIDLLSRRFGGWLDGHAVLEDRKLFDGIVLCLYRTAVDRAIVWRAARLADDGNRVVFHYPEGARADAVLRDHLFTSLSSAPDPYPTPYSVRFDWAIARPNEVHIQGNMTPVTFEDADSDGVCETLRFPDREVREGDTVHLAGADYSVLALDSGNRRAALVSIPGGVASPAGRAADAFNCAVVVENLSGQARTLDCRVFESAEVVESMTFDRSNPMSDLWVPSFQCDAGSPPGNFNTFAMTATLRPDSPTGETIYRDVQLPAGEYAVFARIFGAALPDNPCNADAEFSVVPPEGAKRLIGRLKGNDPSGGGLSDFQETPGWGWWKAGEFRADGKPFRIEIEAFNPDALPVAYFNLDRVMFLPVDKVPPSGPLETRRFEVALGPLEKEVFNVPVQRWPNADKRVDIECFDPASKQFRNIYFYLTSSD